MIKLTHSEIIIKLCNVCNCITTGTVKKETVEQGKKKFYPDADIIEELIKNKKLRIKDPKKTVKEDFGEGELSVLSLCKELKNHILVTDDVTFIRHLEKEDIAFFVPADLIVLLKQIRKISLEESLYHLEKMKVFIKEEVYKSVKKDLEEGLK